MELQKIAELKEAGYINEDILSLGLISAQLIERKQKSVNDNLLHSRVVSLEKIIRVRSDLFCKSQSILTCKNLAFSCNSSQVYVIPNKSGNIKEEAQTSLLFYRKKIILNICTESANARCRIITST